MTFYIIEQIMYDQIIVKKKVWSLERGDIHEHTGAQSKRDKSKQNTLTYAYFSPTTGLMGNW